ncbi:MAG: autotransporter-associated beta strand repeat-containing protein, partial [Thermoguttaceae bacterium]
TNYSSGKANFADSSGSDVLTVRPAPVVVALQSNLDWLLAGQELSIIATASTIAASNGTSLTPDGTVTIYDNGVMLASQSLAVVDGQDQAVLDPDTTTLPLGRNLITVCYTSASGNFSMTSASPVLTEIIFPANAQVLTVDNMSSDPSVSGSLPWAVGQANASSVATLITFATGSGQAFATPQTITLERPLDVTDANSIGIEGPSSGVTLVGDYSQSRFPILSVAQPANLLIQDVSIGTQTPGANGDLQVAGVLDAFPTVANLGSALNVTGGGSIDFGGQAVTADSLTLTDGSLSDGTLSSGARTVLSGTLSANLTGSGGLVKNGSGNVILSGTNSFTGSVQVLAGSLVIASGAALPDGTSLTIGAGGTFVFDPSQSASSASAAGVAPPQRPERLRQSLWPVPWLTD